MEEIKISFETAVLAKEKKFPQLKEGLYYTKDKEHCLVGWGFKDDFAIYSAPTQGILQKYLREIHKIHIEIISFEDDTWGGDLIYKNAPYEWNDKEAPLDVEYCKTYEEALELLLQKALNLI